MPKLILIRGPICAGKSTVSSEPNKESKKPIIQDVTPSILTSKESEVLINESRIERIIIFYSDKSFKEYFPEK